MNTWKHSIREGMLPGLLAGLFSTTALIVQQRYRKVAIKGGQKVEAASGRQAAKGRFTAKALVTQQLSTLAWGLIYQRFIAGRREARPLSQHVRNAALATTAASITNLIGAPQRVAPEFEHRLPAPAVITIYALLAIGMAAGSQWLIQQGSE